MISFWFLVVGALLILMALVGSAVDRLPLSPGLIYLLTGVALGPAGLNIVALDPMSRSPELRLACEIAVIISLFTVGLKLRTSLSDPLWRLPLRLATVSMSVRYRTAERAAGDYCPTTDCGARERVPRSHPLGSPLIAFKILEKTTCKKSFSDPRWC